MQRTPSRAEATFRSLRHLGERAVVPASSLLDGCGPGAAGVAASRMHAIRAPRGWRVGGGDPGGPGLGNWLVLICVERLGVVEMSGGERRSEDGGPRLLVFWKWSSIDGGAILA